MGRGNFVKKKGAVALNITAMMDMFTIILVFLLKSYSADGSILTNADNLILPNSISKKRPDGEVNIQVAITTDMILVDNQAIVPTEEARNIPHENSKPVIEKLKEKLAACYQAEKEMVELGNLNEVSGKIVVQVDKNIEFDVLYKVMFTCGQTGYTKMNFAVMEREG